MIGMVNDVYAISARLRLLVFVCGGKAAVVVSFGCNEQNDSLLLML